MYLNADAQSNVMARFFFSVVPAGFLILGRAEMLSTHGTLFQPVDLKRRIFKTNQTANRHRVRPVLIGAGREDIVAHPDSHARLRQLAFDVGPDPQIVETAYEDLQSTNEELETTNEELQSTNEEPETRQGDRGPRAGDQQGTGAELPRDGLVACRHR
jgi:two-component system CheB/CheR fusion protein